eukprot:m.347378 g.347378  ORF g.347378 m.347378 type:complete len:78 (+) comp32553_c0_seq1:89-322(+)
MFELLAIVYILPSVKTAISTATVLKDIISKFNRRRYADCYQVFAMRKGIVTNKFHRSWESDTGERSAIAERTVSNQS